MHEQILIVEDDAAMANGIRDVLEMAEYKVRVAGNGQQALNILETFTPDLIISDIMMPEMDGFEFLERVRVRVDWILIPFIFLTAKGQRTDIRAGKQLGADDYLVKSTDLEDLLVVVRAKLDRAASLSQRSQAEIAQLKNNILNTLSHEFRTPLTYITGYVDLLQDGGWSVEDLQRFLSRIKGGSTRLNHLVEDFLLLVRFGTNDMKQAYDMDKAPFNAWSSMIARALERLREKAERRSVEIVSEAQPDLPMVEAHPDYLEDIVMRLVDNAIKFSKPGGTVSIWVAAENDRVCLHVTDHGIGIAVAEQPKLFDKFHQINREKIEQQGAGIGLAITKGFVELHHGEIACTSEEGVGSEFVVCLPVLQA